MCSPTLILFAIRVSLGFCDLQCCIWSVFAFAMFSLRLLHLHNLLIIFTTYISCMCSNFRVAQGNFFEIPAKKSHFFRSKILRCFVWTIAKFWQIRLHSFFFFFFCTVMYMFFKQIRVIIIVFTILNTLCPENLSSGAGIWWL